MMGMGLAKTEGFDKPRCKGQLHVVNVVATADARQPVDLSKLNGTSWGLYDKRIYHSGYVKDEKMKGRVIVFESGKLISVGTKSPSKAFAELQHAVKLLASAGLIKEVSLEPRVRNIVACEIWVTPWTCTLCCRV
jgi:TATA-box binding protein (TBP) (component of TFIID and TFIIIB)